MSSFSSRAGSLLRHRATGHVQWLMYVAMVYFGLAYFLAFSRTSGGARTFFHAALVIANLLAVLQCARFFTEPRRAPRHARAVRGLIGILALSLLAITAVLFVDYAVTRWYWREGGWFGEIGGLKEWAYLALLACNTLLLPWGGIDERASSAEGSGERNRRPFSVDVAAAYLALIATPLTGYYILNREVFSTQDLLSYILIFMGIPIAAVCITTAAERVLPSWWGPVMCGLFFTHYSLPMLHGALKVSAGNSALPHLAASILIPCFLAVLVMVERRLFVVLSISYLVLNSSAAYFMDQRLPWRLSTGVNVSEARPQPPAPPPPWRGAIERKPDIFLLLYDGYPNERLFDAYHIDNARQMAFLRSAGFAVYPGTYSLALNTLGSMTRVMEMSASPTQGIVGRNAVNAFLKEAGYETSMVLHPYFFQGDAAPYVDHTFPRAEQASQFATVLRGIAGGEFKAKAVFAESSRQEWLSAKREILTRTTGPPRFLYAHSGFPGHAQNSGACLPDERQTFAAQVAVANEEMREDIRLILESPRESIVIVASDHGPHLTGDCLYLTDRTRDQVSALDLADRYGTLLAVRWPASHAYTYDPPVVLQDIFFSVFAYMMGVRSVLDHRPPRRTFGYGPTLEDGLVVDGRITAGIDRGKDLFSF